MARDCTPAAARAASPASPPGTWGMVMVGAAGAGVGEGLGSGVCRGNLCVELQNPQNWNVVMEDVNARSRRGLIVIPGLAW